MAGTAEATEPATAEAQAAQIIRNNFIQPTVNALGYTLVGFTVHWAPA